LLYSKNLTKNPIFNSLKQVYPSFIHHLSIIYPSFIHYLSIIYSLLIFCIIIQIKFIGAA